MLKCKHQCHCVRSSYIATCIINETGRQAAHKKQRKYHLYIHVLVVNINFQRKTKFKKLLSSTTLYLIDGM
jgi:hypothetical protein